MLRLLYHYERKQGTTTLWRHVKILSILYHYERKQGTTTDLSLQRNTRKIIPLREKTGNYDIPFGRIAGLVIIPLREKTGNYDLVFGSVIFLIIIPLREKTGNYDRMMMV